MRRIAFGALVAGVCLLALSCAARAEEVRGEVTDPSGAMISGALVRVQNGERIIATAKSDDKGSYRIVIEHQQAASGALQIVVSAPGFAAASGTLDFSTSASLNWSVRLEIAAASQQIHVEAKSQPFQDQLDMGEVRESSAKDVGEALTAVDGVWKIRQGGVSNDVVVRGFQQNDVNFLIDGARIYGACPGHMDPPAEHVDFAEVETVEIVKDALESDSAGSLGAEIRVVTKTPPLGLHFTPSLSFGSFNFFNPSATASFGNAKFRVLAGYSYRISDPYKDGSGKSFLAYANYSSAAVNQHAFDINTGWFDVAWTPSDNQRASLSYTRQQSGLVLFPYETMDTDHDNTDRGTVKYEIHNLGTAVKAMRIEGYFTQVIHLMSDRYRTSAEMAMGGAWMMAAEPRSRTAGGKAEFDAGKDMTFGMRDTNAIGTWWTT